MAPELAGVVEIHLHRRSAMSQRAIRAVLAVPLLSLFAVTTTHASGFRLPEASIYGLSSANAVVADPKARGAIAYNPAAMSFHTGGNLVVGLVTIDPEIAVTTAAGHFESDVDTPFYVPNLVITGQVRPTVSIGLTVSSPFGLETNWPNETFPGFGPLPSPPYPPGTNIDGLEPSRSKLEMANFNPNVSVKLGPNTSVAVGIDYYWIKDVRLDTQAIKMAGDGDGAGFNLALMHTAGNWSTGLSWHSRVDTPIQGTISGGLFGQGTSPAKTELTFPAMLQFGVRNQTTPDLALEFDIEHTDWSSFNAITIIHQLPGATLVSSPVVSTNAWDDSLAFRFGGALNIGPATQLRFGYTFDQSPNADEHFSARVPDADRQLFSLGVGQKIGGWELEAGYMYVLWSDRTYDSTAPFGSFGSDANGTNLYNGAYEADAHVFGLGVNGDF
jgi:long-chain fatty acid transport protein